MFVRFRVGIASSFARLVWPPADVSRICAAAGIANQIVVLPASTTGVMRLATQFIARTSALSVTDATYEVCLELEDASLYPSCADRFAAVSSKSRTILRKSCFPKLAWRNCIDFSVVAESPRRTLFEISDQIERKLRRSRLRSIRPARHSISCSRRKPVPTAEVGHTTICDQLGNEILILARLRSRWSETSLAVTRIKANAYEFTWLLAVPLISPFYFALSQMLLKKRINFPQRHF